MGVLDFLFQGSPPPQVTSYQSTSSGLPDWYSTYAQGILARGNAIAGTPATDYFAGRPPQVAPFSADQQSAFNQTRAQQGNSTPYFGQASDSLTQAGQANPLGLATPGLTNAGNANIYGAAQPSLDAAQGYTAYGAGMPFVQQAGQTWPQGFQDYMSPYTDAVTSRIAQLGGRNLAENLLPAVNDTFTGAGQFGSRRHGDFTNRVVRDANESIMGQQAQALEQGYGQAAQIFGQDQSRMAGLGATAGNLAETTRGGLASLGQLRGQLTGSDAANQLGVGQAFGNIGVADAASNLAVGQGWSNLGAGVQAAGLRDSAALEAIGQTQQGQAQNNLTAANQNWMDERDYGKNNATYLNSLLRGLQVPTSTAQTYSGPGQVYQPSPLAQLAQGLGTYGAMKNVI